MSINWNLSQDFNDSERSHSQPRWEWALIDGGDTVAFKKTTAMYERESLYYVPLSVVTSAANDRGPEDN